MFIENKLPTLWKLGRKEIIVLHFLQSVEILLKALLGQRNQRGITGNMGNNIGRTWLPDTERGREGGQLQVCIMRPHSTDVRTQMQLMVRRRKKRRRVKLGLCASLQGRVQVEQHANTEWEMRLCVSSRVLKRVSTQ